MENLSQSSYNTLLEDTVRQIGCGTLYRFRPINDNEIDALENSYLWFSAVDKLNDPFEGCIKLEEIKQDTTMEIALQISISRNSSEQKTEEKIFEINDLIRQSNDFYKREFQAMLSRTKICCFSKLKTSELMWAHYANNHTGMALEYDISFDINLFRFAIPIIYHEKLPEINFMTQQDKSILSVLKNKSNAWSYEQEVRLINDNPRGTPNKIRINNKSLRRVIFGCKTNQDDIEKVKSALKKYNHIEYLKSCISNTEYEITFITLTDEVKNN